LRVGILSDTHLTRGSDRGPLLKLAATHFSSVDAILHAGDIGDLDWLTAVAFPEIPFYAVEGNCDEPGADPRLPVRRIVELGSWRIGLAHGWGAPHSLVDRLAPLFTDVHAVVFGHSHTPHLEKRNKVIYFNPGSLMLPRHGPPSAGLLTIGERGLVFSHITL